MLDTQIKVGVLVVRDDKLLLIREWSNKRNGYFWNIIKGTYGDQPNESLEGCAIRECVEESGYNVQLEGLLHCAVVSSNSIRVQFNFIGSIIGEVQYQKPAIESQKARGEDIKEMRWFSQDELAAMTSKEFINERATDAVHAWMNGDVNPLSVLHSVAE